MSINLKQKNYLNMLLKREKYALVKDINLLAPFEAGLIIQALLNNGRVLNVDNNRSLSKIDVIRRQSLVDNMIIKAEPKASEKQIKYIQKLISSSNYRLKTNDISMENASKVIYFLQSNIEFDDIDKILEKVDYSHLIEKKIIEEPSIDSFSFPSEWIMYDNKLNGIIDY